MTNRVGAAMILFLTTTLVFAQTPPKASDPRAQSDLSQPYPVKLGHLVALSLRDSLAPFMQQANWDAPLLMGYDLSTNGIEIAILGNRFTIDSAKQSVDEFRTKVLPSAIEFVNSTYGVTVHENQLTITYLNRNTGKPMIVWRDGAYSIQ